MKHLFSLQQFEIYRMNVTLFPFTDEMTEAENIINNLLTSTFFCNWLGHSLVLKGEQGL